MASGKYVRRIVLEKIEQKLAAFYATNTRQDESDIRKLIEEAIDLLDQARDKVIESDSAASDTTEAGHE